MGTKFKTFFFMFTKDTFCNGVVWHYGEVVACGEVGPRFKPRQDKGIL